MTVITVSYQDHSPAMYLSECSCSEHKKYYLMGFFRRVEGEGANSKMLVRFKCKAEWFITDSGSMQDCSLLEVFLAKYLGREAKFVLSLVVGLSASLIIPTVMPL